MAKEKQPATEQKTYTPSLNELYSRKIHPTIARISSKILDKSPINLFDVVFTGILTSLSLPTIEKVAYHFLPKVGGAIHEINDCLDTGLYYAVLPLTPLVLSSILSFMRPPLSKRIGTTPRPLSMEERGRNIDYVVEKIKQYKDSPKRQLEDIVSSINESVNKVVYKIDGVDWKGYKKKPRKSIYRGLARKIGIKGAFSPLVQEVYLTDFKGTFLPHVIAHEVSHWRGYMAENDAEFIAYLAGVNSPYDDDKCGAYSFRLVREFQGLKITPSEKIRYIINLSKQGVPHKLRNSIIRENTEKIRRRKNPIKAILKNPAIEIIRGAFKVVFWFYRQIFGEYKKAFTEDLPAFEEKYGREGRNYF